MQPMTATLSFGRQVEAITPRVYGSQEVLKMIIVPRGSESNRQQPKRKAMPKPRSRGCKSNSGALQAMHSPSGARKAHSGNAQAMGFRRLILGFSRQDTGEAVSVSQLRNTSRVQGNQGTVLGNIPSPAHYCAHISNISG